MPWKELSKMDEKLRFVGDCLRGEETMTELCERYGISRETGHVWKKRYIEGGAGALEERSRAPLHHGRQTPAQIAEAIIAFRRTRPHWGATKLLWVLNRREPSIVWPARSTVTDFPLTLPSPPSKWGRGKPDASMIPTVIKPRRKV